MDHEPFSVALEEGKVFFSAPSEYRSPFRKTFHRSSTPSPSLQGGGVGGGAVLLHWLHIFHLSSTHENTQRLTAVGIKEDHEVHDSEGVR